LFRQFRGEEHVQTSFPPLERREKPENRRQPAVHVLEGLVTEHEVRQRQVFGFTRGSLARRAHKPSRTRPRKRRHARTAPFAYVPVDIRVGVHIRSALLFAVVRPIYAWPAFRRLTTGARKPNPNFSRGKVRRTLFNGRRENVTTAETYDLVAIKTVHGIVYVLKARRARVQNANKRTADATSSSISI